MIEINVDLAYLSKHFEIGTEKLSRYEGKSVDEIMKIEAAEGNTKAAKFSSEVLNTPTELVKVFKLSGAKNRYAIIQNMNYLDLQYLLQFLEKEDLVLGLKFFSKEKLMQFISDLPKEKILKVLFESFSVQEFLNTVPEREVNKFFDSEKIDKNRIFDFLKSLDPSKLAQMLENVTGEVQEKKPTAEMLKQFEQLSPAKFKDAIKSLEMPDKLDMIMKLTSQDPKLFQEFEVATLTRPLDKLQKSELIKSMSILESEDLLKMVKELPQDLMAIVATQIDPQIFAEILVKYFKDILSDLSIA